MQEGEAVVPLLPECELEAHDLYQTKFDCPKKVENCVIYTKKKATGKLP